MVYCMQEKKLYEDYEYFYVTAAENFALTDPSSKLPWNDYGDGCFVYIAVDVSLVLHSKHGGGITFSHCHIQAQ